MNRSHLWKLLLVIFFTAWALYSIYPPTTGDILDEFTEKVPLPLRDQTFTNIVNKTRELHQKFPDRKFSNLREAIGTNDITRYFPFINAKAEKNPNLFILHRLQREVAGRIKLGLDLQGGTSFEVEMSTNKLGQAEERQTALSHAVEVLRRRVDNLGVAEPVIQSAGENRILIQLPGLSEDVIESARRQIQRAAFLEFRMVHPESAQRVAEGIIDPGYEVLHEERTDKDGVKRLIPYLVKKEPERGLTGKYLKRAGVSRNPLTNEPEIHFELDAEGAKLFAEITREYSPREGREYQLAIVLDGELRSAPVIRSPIEGGRGQITGSFSVKEAFELASVLENPLEAPVQLVYENTVDPTLGKDSIQSGIRAAVVGTIGVSLFIAIYYLVGGIVANIAMLLNLLLLVGVMCMIGATFTLPGIAGIVLTVGMAVDANVLIFERIREELASGKPLRSALAAGYNKAFGTILDSNLTTLIASALLMKLGTGPIKGFGYTLTVGLVTSMFTALLVTRLIFDFLLAKNLIRSLPMLQLIRPTKIDFLRWAKPAFALSWIIILSGLGYGFYRGADVLSVEFAGGDNMSFAFTKKVEIEQLRQSISQLGLGDTVLQYQKDPGTGRETLRVVTRSLPGKNEDAAQKVEDALKTQFPDAGFQQLSLYKVGASVGREIQRSAIIATLLAMFGILLYVAFRYELSFSVGAIVAIVHDVLMTTGWYFLAGKELNGTTIAALLTIIGFSINDTIVIFDRVREDLKLGVRGTFKEILNHALNQCLSRTIITSGTVLMSTLALYLFGGGVINDFAFCLLVGIITGTYSTIYIASAIVLWWHKGERPKMAAQVQMEAAA